MKTVVRQIMSGIQDEDDSIYDEFLGYEAFIFHYEDLLIPISYYLKSQI